MGENASGGGIRVLPPDIARRIAAGEVIDRPFSVVRELLDNAIDAGAGEITVRLRSGGLEAITVSDDGAGMSADDLALCYQSHSTSKIANLDDLAEVRTLGFRGEALSSIANVSNLRIVSAPHDSGLGHELVVRGNRREALRAERSPRGTTVTVRELFFNLPARKKFLKGASAESNLCRTALIEKALPYPTIAFRLFTGDSLKLYLPPGDLVGRVAAAFDRLVDPPALRLVRGTGAGAEIEAVVADPSVSRGDRRLIQVYVNGRRVYEYAFVQALEYAFDQFLPGGRFPVAFLFMNVDPSLVDFNVHPAKKEARFQNRSELRARVVDLVRSFLSAYEVKQAPERSPDPSLPYDNKGDAIADPADAFRQRGSAFSPKPTSIGPRQGSEAAVRLPSRAPRKPGDASWVHEKAPVFAPRDVVGQSSGIRYLGQVFGLFLVAEIESTLYVVDQHAAHERILFERARRKKGSQPLLIPIVLELSSADDEAFASLSSHLEALGFALSREGSGRWEVSAVPAAASDLPEESLRQILESVDGVDYDKWEWDFYAEIACKAAVKDGSQVDAVTARELLAEAFALVHPRCPHGRPIWFEITRDELFSLVGRT